LLTFSHCQILTVRPRARGRRDNLAAAQGNEDGKKNRDFAAESMTPEQLAEAQRLAREWKPK
jgi:hypothetical protein